MTNRGVAPVDTMTDLGLVRSQVGDLNYVALDPPEAGFGSYDWLSDVEIEAALEVAGGSISRATGYCFRKVAAFFAASALEITTDDLRLASVNRAKLYRELAQDWLASADDEDAAAASDLFEVIPFGGYENQHTKTWPEATARPVIL